MPEFETFVTRQAVLSADLSNGGTFNVSYPSGYNESMFSKGDHKLVVQNGGSYENAKDFEIAFGLTAATVTWRRSDVTIPAGSTVFVQMDVAGSDGEVNLGLGGKVTNIPVVQINLGAPATADADGYVASQDLTAAGVFSVNTTAAAAIAAAALAGNADVPRNVVAAWTGTAVLTVTGQDEYGNTVVESSASGTSFAGKKAFKKVTGVSVSSNVTGLTVGTGDVLGLPVFLPTPNSILAEIEDGANATAGTKVAGVITKATATTGDVRGTYDPNSACNGDKNFSLICALEDPNYKGTAQFAG